MIVSTICEILDETIPELKKITEYYKKKIIIFTVLKGDPYISIVVFSTERKIVCGCMNLCFKGALSCQPSASNPRP